MDFNPNISIEQLNQFIDGELSAEEQLTIEKLIVESEVLQHRLANLQAARVAIKSTGLKNDIKAAIKDYKAEEQHETKVVNMPARKPFRFVAIAATLIVLIGGAIFYQVITTNNDTVFDDNYIAYHLPVNRSTEADTSQLEALYAANNYAGYIEQFKMLEAPTQKEFLLAGVSYLNTGEASKAIDAFKGVNALNTQSATMHYQQEAEFYLLLAYIKNGNAQQAKLLRKQILQNPAHLFYKNAKAISNFSLSVM